MLESSADTPERESPNKTVREKNFADRDQVLYKMVGYAAR